MTNTTPTTAHMPRTNAELCAALRPFPVEQHTGDWTLTTPGTVFDGSMHSFRETDIRMIRLAISWGMPPEEFCPAHQLHDGLATYTAHATTHGGICEYDHTLLELLGLHTDWWEFSHGGYLDLTEKAHEFDLDNTLTWAAGIAIEWLNGLGTTDSHLHADPITPVRCHPYYDRTHSYVTEDNSLYLLANEELY